MIAEINLSVKLVLKREWECIERERTPPTKLKKKKQKKKTK